MKTTSALRYCHWLPRAILALAIACPCGRSAFAADAATNAPVKEILGKVHELAPEILRDFYNVNVTSEAALLLIEADPARSARAELSQRDNCGMEGRALRVPHLTC
jgi:hypothetical protein